MSHVQKHDRRDQTFLAVPAPARVAQALEGDDGRGRRSGAERGGRPHGAKPLPFLPLSPGRAGAGFPLVSDGPGLRASPWHLREKPAPSLTTTQ